MTRGAHIHDPIFFGVERIKIVRQDDSWRLELNSLSDMTIHIHNKAGVKRLPELTIDFQTATMETHESGQSDVVNVVPLKTDSAD